MYCTAIPPIFTPEQLTILRELAWKSLPQFRAYQDNTQGNHFLHSVVSSLDFVTSLVASCSLHCVPMLLMQPADSSIPRHIDDQIRRRALIIQPLLPVVNYSPTYFWESMEGGLLHTAHFTELPVVFNTQVVHSLVNTALVPRINFQLCFDYSYDEILSLSVSGLLFRKL